MYIGMLSHDSVDNVILQRLAVLITSLPHHISKTMSEYITILAPQLIALVQISVQNKDQVRHEIDIYTHSFTACVFVRVCLYSNYLSYLKALNIIKI